MVPVDGDDISPGSDQAWIARSADGASWRFDEGPALVGSSIAQVIDTADGALAVGAGPSLTPGGPSPIMGAAAMWRTTDGGRTWTELSTAPEAQLIRVFGSTTNNLVAWSRHLFDSGGVEVRVGTSPDGMDWSESDIRVAAADVHSIPHVEATLV